MLTSLSKVQFLSLYALGRTVDLWRRHDSTYWWPLASALVTVIIGVLLGSVFLLPAFEMLGVSRRLDPVPLSDALPFSRLISLIIPNFYGSPVKGGVAWWASGNFSEGTIYAGLIALLFACLAPFIDKRFFTRYMSIITIGLLYFIVGGPGVQLLRFIPGIRYTSLHRTSFMIPLMVAFLLAMTLSNLNPLVVRMALIGIPFFLAFLGLAYWFDLGQAKNYLHVLRNEFAIAAGLLIFTFIILWLFTTFKVYQSVLLWGLVLLIFADLYWFGSYFNPAGPINQLMPVTPGISFLQSQKVSHLSSIAPHRMIALQRNNQVLLGPNIATLFSLTEAGGYSSLVNRRYHQLVSAGDPELDVWWRSRQGNMVTFSNPSDRLLDLLQVSHVVAATSLDLNFIQAEFVNDECVAQSEFLGRERPLTGQFIVQNTAINRIDFHFTSQESDTTSSTESLNIRLWQGANQDKLIFETQEDIAALEAQEYGVYFFAPEIEAPGNTYVWEITTDAPETNLSLCMNIAGEPAISVYGNVWTEVYADEIVVYERGAPMPRAYIVYAAEHITDEQQTVNRLFDETFPIRHAAITAERTNLPETYSTPSTSVTILDYQDTRIVIQAKSDQDGLLILGDQYYPGWQATVDGEFAPILRTNHIFRGILLPQGEHEVIFSYRPLSLYVGMGISFSGIVLLGTLLILSRRIQMILKKRS